MQTQFFRSYVSRRRHPGGTLSLGVPPYVPLALAVLILPSNHIFKGATPIPPTLFMMMMIMRMMMMMTMVMTMMMMMMIVTAMMMLIIIECVATGVVIYDDDDDDDDNDDDDDCDVDDELGQVGHLLEGVWAGSVGFWMISEMSGGDLRDLEEVLVESGVSGVGCWSVLVRKMAFNTIQNISL
jgi:hypothetical protein